MSELTCTDVIEDLGGAADDSGVLGAPGRRHVETCLRCQADLAQYRKLLRGLRLLRTEVLVPAPGVLPAVLASLEEVAERQAGGGNSRRAAYLGGIAAATAAGAAGAIVFATRNRRFKLVS